jgi:hypothetical protein
LSQTQAVPTEFDVFPEPHKTAGEIPPTQKYPEGQEAQAVAPLFTI